MVIALAGSTSAVAAVIISNDNQVAQNTIAGHALPVGKHANMISGSVNGTDLSAAYKTSVKVHCPSGTALLSGLCYETGLRGSASWEAATNTCRLLNRRLPTVGELGLLTIRSTRIRATSGRTRGASTASSPVPSPPARAVIVSCT